MLRSDSQTSRLGSAFSRDPAFIGIGFQKCGSSSLFRFLADSIPGFVRPKKERSVGTKELHFFSRRRLMAFSEREKYFRRFPPGEMFGEFTPNYIYSPTSLINISRLFPEAKLLVIVRDPVERFYSALDHAKGIGEIDPDMSDWDAIQGSLRSSRGWISGLLSNGLYWSHLSMAFSIVESSRIFMTTLDRMKSERKSSSEFQRLFDYLGISGQLVEKKAWPNANSFGIGKRADRLPERSQRTDRALDFLGEYYDVQKQALSSDFGLDFHAD